MRKDRKFTDVSLVSEDSMYTKGTKCKFIVLNPKTVKISIPSAPLHGPNIGKVKGSEAVMEVDTMDKGYFKKQVATWRWLGENSGAAWGLEAQLRVALQKIDMLEAKYEDTQDENECKERGLKKKR